MASLLLAAPANSFIPAAGLPWYLAVFGRDAAITAMQSLALGPEIPLGTLRQLGAFQGTRADAWREEEPGKIPHEVRTGELATLGSIPFGRYYGSVDATPLYLMLFAATCRSGSSLSGRGRLPAAVAALLPHAEAALRWIDASTDADGLLWYGPGRRGGIRNQAWKDSRDSMRYADGSIATGRIAAVEVQGYVVSARRGMADVLDTLGRGEEAAAQREAAATLAGLIDERFWMGAEGTYALGIDGQGRQIDGIGSNAGHLLWADAITGPRAAAVTERLMAPDMFTGWGVRTLSSRNPGYNPVGYHVGSVWPHDTSLVAIGMARAGHPGPAQVLFDALLDAAEADPVTRLPELFAGFDRGATPDLVPYPTACAPQAWATGAVFAAVLTVREIPVAKRAARWRSLELDSSRHPGWDPAAGSAAQRRGGGRSSAP
jgi:glycogen debranching enzyme